MSMPVSRRHARFQTLFWQRRGPGCRRSIRYGRASRHRALPAIRGARTYDIRGYGARGDGTALDTAAVQNAFFTATCTACASRSRTNGYVLSGSSTRQ